MLDRIEDALEDLKNGKAIVVIDDENRENEGDLVFLAEKATYENVHLAVNFARGLICVPMSEERAEILGLHSMAFKNTDSKGTAFTVSVDSKFGITTGISVADRVKTIRDLGDINKTSEDFTKPGHIFPLVAKNGGVLEREGHTEAGVDLARLVGASEVSVICEILNEDGTMARVPELKKFAERHNLKMISIEDLIVFRKKQEILMEVFAKSPIKISAGNFNIVGFKNNLDDKEHFALVKGDIFGKENILTRVHSECVTGDVFGSMKCECGSQLHESLSEIEERGEGVFIYLRQEGRGIGITNKIATYALQNKGIDTVDANTLLGFKEELRDYAPASQILKALGIKSIELMSNNPEKFSGLQKYGTVISKSKKLEVGIHKENYEYMKTKKERMGHSLSLLHDTY